MTNMIIGACAVGKITGNYYHALLDKQWGAFWRITGESALLYVAATATRSTTSWLSEMLALRWLPLCLQEVCPDSRRPVL